MSAETSHHTSITLKILFRQVPSQALTCHPVSRAGTTRGRYRRRKPGIGSVTHAKSLVQRSSPLRQPARPEPHGATAADTHPRLLPHPLRASAHHHRAGTASQTCAVEDRVSRKGGTLPVVSLCAVPEPLLAAQAPAGRLVTRDHRLARCARPRAAPGRSTRPPTIGDAAPRRAGRRPRTNCGATPEAPGRRSRHA